MVTKMNQTKLPSVTGGCMYVMKHIIKYHRMGCISGMNIVYGSREEPTFVQDLEERAERVGRGN